ncbi:MAG: metallophosphoesterase [Caldimonas sp.]
MRIQLLSDLHLETERYEPEPAPGAELLVLAGDIDATWAAFDLFRAWPQPILFVAGNHEFDGRELNDAWPALRERCAQLSITMLERESVVRIDSTGRRIRFVGTTRWSDFDLFGAPKREKAMRAAGYYMRVMNATKNGLPYDPGAVRIDALECRAWLDAELALPALDWDATVVVTHFAPSILSADPRYGKQNGTASFCNADDALLPAADLWIHGHLHCAKDYEVAHATGCTRVVCNSRGHAAKGEAEGHRPRLILDV